MLQVNLSASNYFLLLTNLLTINRLVEKFSCKTNNSKFSFVVQEALWTSILIANITLIFKLLE